MVARDLAQLEHLEEVERGRNAEETMIEKFDRSHGLFGQDELVQPSALSDCTKTLLAILNEDFEEVELVLRVAC